MEAQRTPCADPEAGSSEPSGLRRKPDLSPRTSRRKWGMTQGRDTCAPNRLILHISRDAEARILGAFHGRNLLRREKVDYEAGDVQATACPTVTTMLAQPVGGLNYAQPDQA